LPAVLRWDTIRHLQGEAVGRKKKKKKTRIRASDRHVYYEASVQNVDADIDFARKVYRARHHRVFHRLREDFCGTAALACRWAELGKNNVAWGIDLDATTLDWGRERHLARLEEAADRVNLLLGDVRTVKSPKVDVVMALNFSYFVFKQREDLVDYFRNVRKSLRKGGMFILDIFGGCDSMEEQIEKTRHEASKAPDGTRIPAFTYLWEQDRFNPVDHHILCHIHFKPRGGKTLRKAFTYDWRLWMVPEIRDVLAEAGFRSSDVYTEGWDEDSDEPDGIFRKKKRFDNDESWIAYIVGLT
jgi:SAM-dependent methyltransferase